MYRLFASAAIGMLSTVPIFTIYAVVVFMAVLLRWPEWLGPLVGNLCWLGVALGSSAVSGHLCVRMLAGPFAPKELLLANSSGWVCLAYLALYMRLDDLAKPHGVEALLSALCVSIIGLLITWVVIKVGR